MTDPLPTFGALLRRRCGSCREVLPVESFAVYQCGSKPPRRDGYCRPCRLAWKRERNRQRYRLDAEFRARVDADNRKRAKAKQRERASDRDFREGWARRFVVSLQADGWSMTRIALAAGLGHDTLANMLRNERQPRSATFERLWSLAIALEWEQERTG